MTENDIQTIKSACVAATSEPLAQLFQRVAQLEKSNERLEEQCKVLREAVFIKQGEKQDAERELFKLSNRLSIIESYLRGEGLPIEP
ncbi:hypothetical protein THMIRHAS_12500 [Thiosulfatimonas sediminis]|uniref:Uncharacterized protein n=1 Tax=Thiosulfatimonas sediminis TaxID=2675054 RepID=A0A6F8PV17_9GAMM|nr:hypothetical protein [Thiosulfatimonas sediminis]BBP45877.1 hypothetical protein THMIRHAS_12500 [Thiosulfatimonas sediminis]